MDTKLEGSNTIRNRVDGFRTLGITGICRNLKKYKSLDYLWTSVFPYSTNHVTCVFLMWRAGIFRIKSGILESSQEYKDSESRCRKPEVANLPTKLFTDTVFARGAYTASDNAPARTRVWPRESNFVSDQKISDLCYTIWNHLITKCMYTDMTTHALKRSNIQWFYVIKSRLDEIM